MLGVGFAEGVVYAFRDLTEERRVEEMKSDFVATVSHELRTPLAAIHGSALTILRPDLELEDELKGRLLQVIADESAAARADRQRPPARVATSTRAASSCRSRAATRWSSPARGRGGADAPARQRHGRARRRRGAAVGRGRPGQLRQVLENLVENAIKYSPDGGAVVLRIGRTDGLVSFRVRDQGLGIPHAEHRRVFEKFYRLDPNMTRGIGGTGLGLYISRELVRMMGGRIWVESEPARGSTFTVEIPRRSSSRRQPGRTPRAAAAAD